MSSHKIAKEFGIEHGSVIYRLRQYGIPIRRPASGERSPVQMNIEELKQMYVSGMTLKEIADAKGFRWESVRKYLRRAGVQMRARHSRIREICKERGCTEPVLKVWHNVLKGYYGTRCAVHRKQHYAILNRHRVRRMRNLTPDKWVPRKLKYPEMQTASIASAPNVLPTRCNVKACGFPAVNDGLCRKHFLDSQLETSPLGSSCLPAIREAHLLFIGDGA
jgi:hypothetical protein